jgi:NADH dehydrogenase (ubiquinone) Fe-S protein 2
MEFYERACGARLHSAFIRPGGISKDISDNLLLDIQKFCYDTVYRIDEIEDLLSNNRIWCNRLKGIGVIPIDKVFD